MIVFTPCYILCVDISRVKDILSEIPKELLSPTSAYGMVKMTIAVMMVKTGFVRPTNISSSSSHVQFVPTHFNVSF